MNFWAGLYKPEFQSHIAEGVRVLLSMACHILVNHQRAPPRLLPVGDDEPEPEEAAYLGKADGVGDG